VLNSEGKAWFNAPGDEHNTVTSWITGQFTLWSKRRWGYASATNKVRLNNQKSVDPDISFWGYTKCRWEYGFFHVKLGDMTPDVCIQFCWKNSWAYEENAMNDLMNRAVATPNPDVRVGYLIKMRFENGQTKPPTGLDVYKVPRGTTVADALENRNGAQHMTYTPGTGDLSIEITASDLGITGFGGFFCTPFKVSMKSLNC
jgi:hypothetical protein